MRPDVSLQQPRSGKALSAVGALATLVVGPQVHGVGWHGDVGLVTMGALSGLLVFQGPVAKNIIRLHLLTPWRHTKKMCTLYRI